MAYTTWGGQPASVCSVRRLTARYSQVARLYIHHLGDQPLAKVLEAKTMPLLKIMEQTSNYRLNISMHGFTEDS